MQPASVCMADNAAMGGTICVGDRRFDLELRQQGGQWTAEARSADTGAPVGPPCVAPTAEQATERLTRWLAWQQEHTAALERLQEAERAYYRLVTGSAFVASEISDLQHDALQQHDDARRALDEVRVRQP